VRTPQSSLPLAAAGVLVTRPDHQADGLCRLIDEAGGVPIRFPSIAIAPPDDPDAARAVLSRFADYHLVLFISANAVRCALELAGGATTPAHTQRIAAVGRATANALRDAGIRVDLQPISDFSSESLLALDEMQKLQGSEVLIVRGHGGRELLTDTLSARGARVSYAEVYRRSRPQVDPEPLLRRWAQGDVCIVSATSGEALDNLIDMLGQAGRQLLLSTPVVVLSQRTAGSARDKGFDEVLVAQEASDAGIVATLSTWAGNRRDGQRR